MSTTWDGRHSLRSSHSGWEAEAVHVKFRGPGSLFPRPQLALNT